MHGNEATLLTVVYPYTFYTNYCTLIHQNDSIACHNNKTTNLSLPDSQSQLKVSMHPHLEPLNYLFPLLVPLPTSDGPHSPCLYIAQCTNGFASSQHSRWVKVCVGTLHGLYVGLWRIGTCTHGGGANEDCICTCT